MVLGRLGARAIRDSSQGPDGTGHGSARILADMKVHRVTGLLMTAAVLVGCGGSDGPDEPDVALAPDQLVLRLSDLPSGYTVGDDASCDASAPPSEAGSIGVEGAGPRLRDLILEERPVGCNMQLERLYDGTSEPPRIESMAFVFETAEGAEAGFALAPELLAYVTGEDNLRPATFDAELGDETRAFGTDHALVAGEIGRPGFAIAWRSGSVLGAILTGGIAGEAGERTTLALAERQQARIEAPTPVRAVEQDDREVALDNPELGIPIYWLGREFAPGGGLPDLRLYEASGPYGPGGSPGNVVKIDYTRAVNIDLWERAKWDRFLHTRLGRLVWDSPCAQGTKVGLARGQAVIYAGYASRAPLPAPTLRSQPGQRAPRQTEPPEAQAEPCPKRPFDRYLAHVYFGDVVVSVNLPYCFACSPRPTGARDPYNSKEGMEAIVRGLHRRRSVGSG